VSADVRVRQPVRQPVLSPGTGSAFGRQATPAPERALPADPVEWLRQEGDGFLWSRQREIARSVQENRETLVPSCHGPGKTRLAATLAVHWIEAHAPGEAFVVTTAPSDRQVRTLLWRELGRVHRAVGGQGSLAGTTWSVGPAGGRELVAFGSKPGDLVDKEQAMQRFQGIHARYLLAILDEATGVPGWLWDAIDTLVTNEGSRILAIGNPDDPTSAFAARCDASTGSLRPPGEAYWSRLGARVIPIDAYQTPNLTGEHVPEYLRELLVSREWVEQRERAWGKDSPLFRSKVRGVFPDRSTHNVVSPALLRRAYQLDLPGHERGAFGVDVARSVHGDESSLYRDRAGVIRHVHSWREPDLTRSADLVERLTAHVPEAPVAVDVDGVGGGLHDILRRRGKRTVAFSVNMPPRNPRDFDSRRSEVWWAARQELEAGLWDLDDADEELAAQLTAPRWRVDPRGRIHVETKDELAKRGISSPDRADAAIMARFGRPPIGAGGEYPRAVGVAKTTNGAGSITGDLLRRPL
jgi:hypothetical protein